MYITENLKRKSLEGQPFTLPWARSKANAFVLQLTLQILCSKVRIKGLTPIADTMQV